MIDMSCLCGGCKTPDCEDITENNQVAESDIFLALQGIVNLKRYKDKFGEDANYVKFHGIAWKNAINAVERNDGNKSSRSPHMTVTMKIDAIEIRMTEGRGLDLILKYDGFPGDSDFNIPFKMEPGSGFILNNVQGQMTFGID